MNGGTGETAKRGQRSQPPLYLPPTLGGDTEGGRFADSPFPRHSRLLPIISLAFIGIACHAKAPHEGKSVAELRRMLGDSKSQVQVQGAFGLSQLGPQAKDAVPDLAEALKSPDLLLRQSAALALEKIGPDAHEAVPALKEALRDPEWQVRRQAALALGQIGPAAKPAIGDLEKLAKDPIKRVKDAAREALKRIRD